MQNGRISELYDYIRHVDDALLIGEAITPSLFTLLNRLGIVFAWGRNTPRNVSLKNCLIDEQGRNFPTRWTWVADKRVWLDHN